MTANPAIHDERETAMTERHEEHKETLSNGCKIAVKAEILRDGSLKMFIGVYRPDGSVIEEDEHPSPHLLDLEGAMEWAIEKAKDIGNKQHTL
jgi:porphobilinogen deaminase